MTTENPTDTERIEALEAQLEELLKVVASLHLSVRELQEQMAELD